MRKITYKTTMVEQKEPYIIYEFCERCGKLIQKFMGDHFREEYTPPAYGKEEVHWYEVTTGHHDWGNDSCESIDTKIVCPRCITEEYSDYIDRSCNHGNTEYMDIQHGYGWSMPLDEEPKGE